MDTSFEKTGQLRVHPTHGRRNVSTWSVNTSIDRPKKEHTCWRFNSQRPWGELAPRSPTCVSPTAIVGQSELPYARWSFLPIVCSW